MGRGGNRNRGGNRKPAFRGSKGKNRNTRDTRTEPWSDVIRGNELFEGYYRNGEFLDEKEFEEMWKYLATNLPNSFRFTGTKADALAVREIFKKRYVPGITQVTFDGEPVDPPRPVNAFPDELVWDMKTDKKVIRRSPPFAEFQKFLVAETTSGNISRQEVVSMIPPHFLDVRPGMVVLDMCAAPGSKSAQLAEMIHGDEEERVKKAATNVDTNADFDNEGGDYSDGGRSTGLLIANDTDFKRAGMLVHQVKRLNFPNLIVTQHDASIFPSIELPSGLGEKRQYLKFDRILADVPCSGDGTARKNVNVWQKWTPKDALGLHNLQMRILSRGLQMLKKGGRLVYSTCSMNPVENEAVVASAIETCGGVSKVQLVDCSNHLPNLIRKPGLSKWKVYDTSTIGGEKKTAHLFNSWDAFCKTKNKYQEQEPGRTFSPKISEGMFPPATASEEERIPLERCMRVYPHLQDTGAFFIAVLEKKDDIKVSQVQTSSKETTSIPTVGLGAVTPVPSKSATDSEVEPTILEKQANAGSEAPSQKRKLERVEESTTPKRAKVLASNGDNVGTKGDASMQVNEAAEPTANGLANGNVTTSTNELVDALADKAVSKISSREIVKKLEPSSQTQKEYFEYLPADDPTIADILNFFGISDRFPRDRFMVKNKEGLLLNKLYYTSELAKTIISLNKDRGMKFVHCGVIMFVAHKTRDKDLLKCPWRLQGEGIKILAPWASKRIIKCVSRTTLYKMLIEMFPKLPKEGNTELGEVGEQLVNLEPGCCFVKIEKSEGEGFPFDMVFPLWRHPGSINLMVDKDDRKAILLRLYNEQNPNLINHVADAAKMAEEKTKANDAMEEETLGEDGEAFEGEEGVNEVVEEVIEE
ncbi:S-adenosyl-L-methionine-dependent methyltransferase [Lojkania enalia]|uniref:S-adenosyl-L-methionine-dependent methyltransferase n=1 Tax=Lojkania enalia TaxID=147567 RepID=A0A9P4K5Z6_9PLEO|nr:S-adenosyl-L-methionine-dependent methyltransferase [Didymosphaeria enalia]